MISQPDHRAERDARRRDGDGLGEASNAFLASQAHWLKPGWKALAVADGEGRHGVWLAEQGLGVLGAGRERGSWRRVALTLGCALNAPTC